MVLPSTTRALRTDSRTLHQKAFSGGTLLVEYATNTLIDPTQLRSANDEILALLARATRVHLVTYVVDRRELVSRYIARMKDETLRRTPGILRYLRIGKLKAIIRLSVSQDVEKGYANWQRLLDGLPSHPDLKRATVVSPQGQKGRYIVNWEDTDQSK